MASQIRHFVLVSDDRTNFMFVNDDLCKLRCILSYLTVLNHMCISTCSPKIIPKARSKVNEDLRARLCNIYTFKFKHYIQLKHLDSETKLK